MPKKVIIVDDDVGVLPVNHFVKLTADPGRYGAMRGALARGCSAGATPLAGA
jgi:hypothetical protein